MTPEDIVSKVLGVDRSQVDDHTSNQTVAAWDSMGHINLLVELEATYGVSVSPEEALAMTDVATIKRILQSRGATWV